MIHRSSAHDGDHFVAAQFAYATVAGARAGVGSLACVLRTRPHRILGRSENVRKFALFGPLRRKSPGEWGGSAHSPDPTAQSAPRPWVRGGGAGGQGEVAAAGGGCLGRWVSVSAVAGGLAGAGPEDEGDVARRLWDHFRSTLRVSLQREAHAPKSRTLGSLGRRYSAAREDRRSSRSAVASGADVGRAVFVREQLQCRDLSRVRALCREPPSDCGRGVPRPRHGGSLIPATCGRTTIVHTPSRRVRRRALGLPARPAGSARMHLVRPPCGGCLRPVFGGLQGGS